VGQLLKSQGHSLHANAKVIEGNQSPDRITQFGHINARVHAALASGLPVIACSASRATEFSQVRHQTLQVVDLHRSEPLGCHYSRDI
jgi:elongation factor P hydroxylase